MKVTIYDVAKRAGVGIGTVSRVINNSPQISPKTRKKVLKVINELKYQPHAMAQSLARKKTNTIACIVPDFTGYFFMALLSGIQSEMTSHGLDLILYSVDEPNKQETFLKRTLREKKVDGVLLLSLQISERYVEKFTRSGFPIVLVDSLSERLDSFAVENIQGGFIATQHLIETGHRRIAMITGSEKSTPAVQRLTGYRQALTHYHLPYDERLVFQVKDQMPQTLQHNHGFNKHVGYAALQQFLALDKERPTAVFAASDVQAMGAIRAATDARLQIPDDVAIIGYDDIELAELLDLTTMRQPMYQMGQLAIRRLVEKMETHDPNVVVRNFVPELIVRKSTGGRHQQRRSA